MRKLCGLVTLGIIATPLIGHAQTAMHKADTMAQHCQQPVKTVTGAQVKNAQGNIVTKDCPQQGKSSHPSVAPQNQRTP